MPHIDERYADLIVDDLFTNQHQLLDDLDALLRTTAPPNVRASIACTLEAHAAQSPARPQTSGLQRIRHYTSWPNASTTAMQQWRMRLIPIIAAMFLVGGGAIGYFRLQTPGIASAAALLQHVYSAPPLATADQAIHETLSLYMATAPTIAGQQVFASPLNLTIDEWSQLDSSGTLTRQVISGVDASGHLVVRALLDGQTMQVYGTHENTISTESVPAGETYQWLANPLNITNIGALLATAQNQPNAALHLLPSQTLDGIPVNAVQISLSPDGGYTGFFHTVGNPTLVTMYIDAHTYTIRGMDEEVEQSSGATTLIAKARVTTLNIVSSAEVPANTFSLGAPANAHILTPEPSQPPDQSPVQQSATELLQPTLLADHPLALPMQEMERTIGSDFTALRFYYQASRPDHSAGSIDSAAIGQHQFVLSFAQFKHAPELNLLGSPLSLTIAGQQVQAYYMDEPALEPLSPRRLVFQQGATIVEIFGQALTKQEFLAAIGTLVDARSHLNLLAPKMLTPDGTVR